MKIFEAIAIPQNQRLFAHFLHEGKIHAFAIDHRAKLGRPVLQGYRRNPKVFIVSIFLNKMNQPARRLLTEA